MPTILDEIIAYKREYLAGRKCDIPQDEWEAQCRDAARRPLDFAGALRCGGPAEGLRLIAEVKKASPSAGAINTDSDPAAQARAYSAGGAHAISVLTDRKYFFGSEDYLSAIRASVPDMPLLRKEFIVDPYQVYEARALGADAVLLIAACLERVALADLLALTHELGMEALVEIYEESELERIDGLPVRVLGVNNRNLRTFEVSLEHSAHILGLLSPEKRGAVAFVSESGVKTVEDARYLHGLGVDAILVGESLMRADDPAVLIKHLTNPF